MNNVCSNWVSIKSVMNYDSSRGPLHVCIALQSLTDDFIFDIKQKTSYQRYMDIVIFFLSKPLT